MRYSEVRLLQWKQIDFVSNLVTVGRSKTQPGTGRAAQFPDRKSVDYVFPFERCGGKGELEKFGFNSGAVYYDTDPARPVGDWKEAWEKAKKESRRSSKRNWRSKGTATPEHEPKEDVARISARNEKARNSRTRIAGFQVPRPATYSCHSPA
jgi:hypothetical protein